ncbi:MAG: hypothetical protein ACR2RA_14975 [Geminicoccaceae bacterium]
MAISETYPAVARLVKLYCHGNDYDLDALRKQVSKEKWLSLNPSFKDDFHKVISERMFDPDEYFRLTRVDYETAEEVAVQLQAIFDFVYNDGPHP